MGEYSRMMRQVTAASQLHRRHEGLVDFMMKHREGWVGINLGGMVVEKKFTCPGGIVGSLGYFGEKFIEAMEHMESMKYTLFFRQAWDGKILASDDGEWKKG